jgi:hypothetical protein
MNEPEYHPNTQPEPEDKSGLYCFKDHARPCAADCMAYVEPPEGPEYVGRQWARCMILVNTHRTGKHLTIIANIVGKIEQRLGAAAADAKRTNQTPPPRPTG